MFLRVVGGKGRTMQVRILKSCDTSYGRLEAGTVVNEITTAIADMEDWVKRGYAVVTPDDSVERGAQRRVQASAASPSPPAAASQQVVVSQKTLKEFTDFLNKCVAEKWGYVWGGNGKLYNETERDFLYNNFRTSTYDKTYYYTTQWNRWARHKVADCSGLLEAFCGQNIVAQDYYSRCLSKGTTAGGGFKKDIGYLLFRINPTTNRMIHVGAYIGNGNVIESRDSASGVMKTTFTEKIWTHWGKPDFINFATTGSTGGTTGGATGSFTCNRVLKFLTPMLNGADVKGVQAALVREGYSVGKAGADGYFGKDTDTAVRAYQKKKNLTIDGIVGKNTVVALGGKWTGV